MTPACSELQMPDARVPRNESGTFGGGETAARERLANHNNIRFRTIGRET